MEEGGPGQERLGLHEKEMKKAENNNGRSKQDLRRMKDHQGRASKRTSWASREGIKDRAPPSEEQAMKAETREEREGQKQRGQGKPGKAGRERRTESKISRMRETKHPPWTGESGAEPQRTKDWIIQSGAKKQEGGYPGGRGAKNRHKPGLDHPGKNKKTRRRAPWTGATGGPRSRDESQTRTGTSGEGHSGKRERPLNLSNRGKADSNPEQDLPGRKTDGPGLECPGLN